MKDSIKHLYETNDFEEALPEPKIKTQKYLNCSEPIAILLARGWTVTGAAAKYNLDRSTVQRWMDTPHFAALLEAKKDEYRDTLLTKIEKAGDKEHLWTANSWILERSKVFKGEYAQPKAISGATGNIQINVQVGSPPGEASGVTVTIGENTDETDNISGGLEEKDKE